MPEGKQTARNHVWGRKPTEQTKNKESEAKCYCYFSHAGGSLGGGLHPCKIMLNYNHILSFQIINKSI